MVRVLPIDFGVVLGCKGGGGKKKLLGPRNRSGAGLPNRVEGQVFHHAKYFTKQHKSRAAFRSAGLQ